jgi:CDP-glucose 4,6-dehydratase
MVERVLRVLGSDLEPEVLGEAGNEIRDQYLSAARARAMGWAPLFGLDDALERTVAWYRAALEDRP